MEDTAIQLIKDFIAEKLSGDVNNITTFDFRTLEDSEKFGCPQRYFDCDDTEIMRAIYVVLWGELLPGLSMNNFGYRRQYRGDTMNTFHTMFGRELEGRPGFFAGLEKYGPSEELREKVRNFSKLCSSVGNYVVLPNYYTGGTTMNLYRGTNQWHDFFDCFLLELYQVLTGIGKQDTRLVELVKSNDFCFRKFRSEKGFADFADGLLLMDYCGENGQPKQIFSMNYHWKNEQDREQYFRDAEQYLAQTETIIKRRSEMICQLLCAKLLKLPHLCKKR
ncbi:MAG: hypothetical protein IKB16_00750 [Lentisphaeria bacterium]|nr:hypothetical protein [Lentisphaeria bacterium]